MPFEVFHPTMSLKRAMARTGNVQHVSTRIEVQTVANPATINSSDPADRILCYRIFFKDALGGAYETIDAATYSELTRVLKSHGAKPSDPWQPA